MSCMPLCEDGNTIGWVCTRGRSLSEPCYICGKPAIRLCDYDEGSGSCDRTMCRKHSHHSAKDTDYCAEHYNELVSRQTTL